MASPEDRSGSYKTHGILFTILHRLESVYGLLKDEDEEAKRELRETMELVSAVEPFTRSRSSKTSPLLQYIMKETAKLDFDKLRSEGKIQLSVKFDNDYVMGMISDTGQVQLLQLLVSKIQAKNILEVGTYLGYAAFGMAEAMPPGGKVTGIEREQSFCDFVTRTAEEHSLNVAVIQGCALPVLTSLAERGAVYDFIYVDCVKMEYQEYYKIIMDNNMLHKNGILAVDNTILKGTAITCENIEGKTVNDFSKIVAEDVRVTAVMLPCYDGMYLIQHK